MTGRGRGSGPTPLPSTFSSWRDLYLGWEEFRTTEPQSRKPSRAERFATLHNMPLWLMDTVTYIFRAEERDDDVGAFAKKVVVDVEAGITGAPKAQSLIRAYVAQAPQFRTRSGQLKAMNGLIEQLLPLSQLARNIRNINKTVTDEELEQFLSNITKMVRELSQAKGRVMEALNQRKEEQNP